MHSNITSCCWPTRYGCEPTILSKASSATYFTASDESQFENRALIELELTVRVAFYDHHASQLADAQLCYFFALGSAFNSFQNAALYYAADALI